jgi:hypothetical protein
VALQGTIDYSQFRAQDWGSTKQYRFGIYHGPAKYSNWFTHGGTGDPATAGDFQLGQIHVLSFEIAVNAAGLTLQPSYRIPGFGGPANGGILWFDLQVGAEVADGIDLSGHIAFFTVVGL